jgi:hypothetical protein
VRQGFSNQVDALSAEWERLGLACAIPKHDRLDRLAGYPIDPEF